MCKFYNNYWRYFHQLQSPRLLAELRPHAQDPSGEALHVDVLLRPQPRRWRHPPTLPRPRHLAAAAGADAVPARVQLREPDARPAPAGGARRVSARASRVPFDGDLHRGSAGPRADAQPVGEHAERRWWRASSRRRSGRRSPRADREADKGLACEHTATDRWEARLREGASRGKREPQPGAEHHAACDIAEARRETSVAAVQSAQLRHWRCCHQWQRQ